MAWFFLVSYQDQRDRIISLFVIYLKLYKEGSGLGILK